MKFFTSLRPLFIQCACICLWVINRTVLSACKTALQRLGSSEKPQGPAVQPHHPGQSAWRPWHWLLMNIPESFTALPQLPCPRHPDHSAHPVPVPHCTIIESFVVTSLTFSAYCHSPRYPAVCFSLPKTELSTSLYKSPENNYLSLQVVSIPTAEFCHCGTNSE